MRNTLKELGIRLFNVIQTYIKRDLPSFTNEGLLALFGSVIEEGSNAREVNDIDILIISSQFKDPQKRSEFFLKIAQKIGPLSPFEFHLITPKDYKDWYSHFIKKKIEIK